LPPCPVHKFNQKVIEMFSSGSTDFKNAISPAGLSTTPECGVSSAGKIGNTGLEINNGNFTPQIE
jgi:hypothetical protein